MRMERILVPLDGSALAECVLPRIIDLVRDTGARVDLLRTVLRGQLEEGGGLECERYRGPGRPAA